MSVNLCSRRSVRHLARVVTLAGLLATTAARTVASEPSPILDWERPHEPAGSLYADGAWAGVESSGDVTTVGIRRLDGGFETETAVVRHDAGGAFQWEGTFPDSQAVHVNALLLPEGDVVVATVITGFEPRIVVRRVTAPGDSVWSHEIAVAPVAPAQMPAYPALRGDGLWVASRPDELGRLTRYDLDGNVLWSVPLADSGGVGFRPTDVAVAPDGTAYVGGEGLQHPGIIARSVAVDPDGTFLWEHIQPGAIGSLLGDVFVQVGPDSLPVLSTSPETDCGGIEAWTWKLDRDGDLVWEDDFPDVFCEEGRSRALTLAPDGGPVVAGTYSVPGGDLDFHVIRYSPAGERVWMRSFDGPGTTDVSRDVVVDATGSIYVTGHTTHPPQDRDVLLLKLAPDGSVAWWADWGVPAGTNDYGLSVAVGPDNEVVVGGHPTLLTLRWSQDPAVTVPVADGPRSERLLLGAFPNPTPGATTVRYALPRRASLTLRILDVRGAPVRTLVAGERPRGSHAATWDGRDAAGQPTASGVYFVRLEAAGHREAERIVITR
ncbi:MAG TPA: FlgD immunoglobulin-like domain containing protein [bacterium]|nr:FlgD immunoglobulin-like domain containing protein [bacterium]